MGTQLVNDAENLAIQMISDTAGYVAHQQTKSIPDDYHQSQKASRSAGHITQTTIEQQWESQLINDAEFTANAQLPSVTFDVNNSYVSQQLGQRVGEEVSHFYHPTSQPRNPNGFWQRIEQRYKNNFEHRALIAEGRAEANSEVMSESLGHAAANQQNYLDLGYSESNAQYGAAWIAATELPLRSAAKGIMQTARLMNRWGFFGHNGAEGLSMEAQLQAALEKAKIYQKLDDISVSDVNSAAALRNKLSAISKAQNVAEKIESTPEGRIRYYRKFRMANKPGPTSGSRFVTEYDPKTGNITEWNETYDQAGVVNRIHLKNINGIQINSPHFPPTLKDILEEGYVSNISLNGGF